VHVHQAWLVVCWSSEAASATAAWHRVPGRVSTCVNYQNYQNNFTLGLTNFFSCDLFSFFDKFFTCKGGKAQGGPRPLNTPMRRTLNFTRMAGGSSVR